MERKKRKEITHREDWSQMKKKMKGMNVNELENYLTSTFGETMNKDIMTEILTHLGTTTGIPKKLSLVNKEFYTLIDEIYNTALKSKDCAFLTDNAKGCSNMDIASRLNDVCHDYCLQSENFSKWFPRHPLILQWSKFFPQQWKEDDGLATYLLRSRDNKTKTYENKDINSRVHWEIRLLHKGQTWGKLDMVIFANGNSGIGLIITAPKAEDQEMMRQYALQTGFHLTEAGNFYKRGPAERWRKVVFYWLAMNKDNSFQFTFDVFESSAQSRPYSEEIEVISDRPPSPPPPWKPTYMDVPAGNYIWEKGRVSFPIFVPLKNSPHKLVESRFMHAAK